MLSALPPLAPLLSRTVDLATGPSEDNGPRRLPQPALAAERIALRGPQSEETALTHLPRAILFDLDDTILSAYAEPEAAWLSVAEQFADQLAPLSGLEVVDKIIASSREFWSDPERHRVGRLRLFETRRENVAAASSDLAASGHRVPPMAVAHALADRFSEYREEQMHLFPDAHQVVDTLKKRGVLLALVTNGAADAQRAKIERFELAHLSITFRSRESTDSASLKSAPTCTP